MSIQTRLGLLAAPLLLTVSLATAADDSKGSTAATKSPPTAKSSTAERAVETTTTRPAETDGSVTRALTRLYQIPRPGQAPGSAETSKSRDAARSTAAPRQFAATGRGEAPRPAISEENRMGYQHLDAINNSVTPPPMSNGARPTNPQPAIPRESSLTAYNWSPYPDAAHENGGDAMGNLDDTTAGESEDYRFGFTQGYRYGRWAQSGGARVQAVIAHSNTHMSRGLAAFRAGQYRTAVKYFKLASDTNRGNPAAMIYAAHALFAIGRYQESASFLRKAFTLEPRIALLTYDLREDYPQQAAFEEQVRALNNAVASSPRDLDRLTVLGYVHNYSDRPDRAFEVLTRARALAPKDKLVQLLYESTSPPDVVTEKK